MCILDTCRCVSGLSCFWHNQIKWVKNSLVCSENTGHGCVKYNLWSLVVSFHYHEETTQEALYSALSCFGLTYRCILYTCRCVFDSRNMYNKFQSTYSRNRHEDTLTGGTSSGLMAHKTTWAIFSPLKNTSQITCKFLITNIRSR